jgi:fructose-bisphosphate aldolase class I
VPIIEPEVDIHAKDKRECETRLKGMMLDHLDHVPNGQQVIFKINLPEQENFYRDLIEHPKTLKVVAMSGGYSLEEACSRLSMNKDIIASFSRALTDGLTRSQTDEEFNNTLQTTVEKVWAASISPQYR